METQFKLLKNGMLAAIVALAFVSCSIEDDSNDLGDPNSPNTPNNPAYASGTISFKLNGEDVNITISEDGISIPSENACNGNYPDWCYVGLEGITDNYGVAFRVYEFSEGLFENSENNNPFEIGVFEAKDGALTGKVEVIAFYDDKDVTCKLNITNIEGFRLMKLDPSFQRGNLDKLLATFELEIPETQHQEKISITEGKIEASYK